MTPNNHFPQKVYPLTDADIDELIDYASAEDGPACVRSICEKIKARKDPQWVIEVRKENKRLQRRIAGIQKKIDSDQQSSYDYEDLDNLSGWLHALRWALKMRAGKATRLDAWGRS